MTQGHEQKNLIELQVITSSGNFPESGFKQFNIHVHLETVLHEAATHLKLQNTNGWVARLADRQLDPSLTLEANHIPDKSKIFWAPTEPGGGRGIICIPTSVVRLLK
jgi:hypothetical protein